MSNDSTICWNKITYDASHRQFRLNGIDYILFI